MVLLLAAILFIPITIYASYFDDFRCVIFLGFIKIPIYPPKPKKKKQQKKKTKSAPKSEAHDKDKPGLIKENGILWFLELIKRISKLAVSVLKDFFGHILIKKLTLSIKVAGDDAADTAIKYGECCSVVYPAVSVITRTFNCPKYGVDIMPDFNEKAESKLEFEFKARVFVFRLLQLVIRHGFSALKLLADLKS